MPRALLALLALLVGCAERRPSDGSRLEGPLPWPPPSPLVLPDDVLSLTVMATGPPNSTLTLDVREPGGRVLVDGSAAESSVNRVIPGRGMVVGMIPASSAALPLPRTLEVSAPGATGGALWIKRGAPPAIQELPLAVVTATAVDATRLDLALGEAGRIWRAAGIELGEPARLTAPELDRVTVDAELAGDSPDVGRALALASAVPAGTLALVVVGDVAVAGGYAIWALAGGIPVPPLAATPRSGVVVSAFLVQRDPVWAGQVMAHEIGHALGLFHTTEAALSGSGRDRPIGDGVDDTPLCPAAADRSPRDGVLSAAECDGADASNLMFWSVPRGATALTAGQGDLARRSVLAR
jgi:hypothetical protein